MIRTQRMAPVAPPVKHGPNRSSVQFVDNACPSQAKALGLGDHLVADEHTGAQGGVDAATRLFASNNTADWGSINLETNCGDHTHRRALEEAADLNSFFNFGDRRQKGRAGSFCMERSGFNEAGLNDQGSE